MRIASELSLAVLNSLWQAAVIAALVWVVLKFVKQINAATRYAIWWAVLGVVLALPAAPRIVTWWHSWERTPLAEVVNRPAPARAALPLIEEQPAMVTLNTERAARWPLWVAGLWAALSVYRLWQIGRSYVYLRGVKRRARLAPESVAPLPEVSRLTRLLLSQDVASPMAVGFLHPAVILPEDLPTELAQPEMEHVLLHEAAHIARRDDWTNLLAKLLGAALALHPVAWWILRQIEREREIACDDWVVARVGSARPYAESLARMSELRWARQRAQQGEALASGIFGGGSVLGQRIERLLERGRAFSPRVSKVRVAVSGVVLLGCVMAGAIVPKAVAFAQRMEFEVASVRQHTGHMALGPISISGSHVTAADRSVFELIRYAYKVWGYQIAGGPGWIGSPSGAPVTFDIAAKAPGDGEPSTDRVRQMFQALLADRFQLQLHRETREVQVYTLVVGKGGSKLKESGPGGDPAGATFRPVENGAIHLATSKGDMEQLIFLLTNNSGLDRPVLDRTGLIGTYDYKLDWAARGTADAGAPSIFTAVQEQLGLKLEPAKAPVEVLVIDHVEKPDAN